MSNIVEEILLYDPIEKRDWASNQGHCIDLLLKSNAPIHIKRCLAYKKGFVLDDKGKLDKMRGIMPRKTMHYDVAKYVVSNSKEIKAGWYGSFDWLQNPNWADDPNSFVPGTMDEFMAEREKEYQKALFYKVGRDRIQKLHKEVNKYGKGNVAEPDLWLIKKDESFQFIEVKIDRTRTSLAQINALKLLSKVLEADVRIVRFVKK